MYDGFVIFLLGVVFLSGDVFANGACFTLTGVLSALLSPLPEFGKEFAGVMSY
jgi:hypothetical protein